MIISFLIKGLVDVFDLLIIPQETFIPIIMTIIYVLVAFILSILITKIYECPLFKKVVLKISHKTGAPDIWGDIVDKKGTTIKMYLKNDGLMYIGKLHFYEENGNDSWFVLHEYIVQKDGATIYNSKTSKFPSLATINLQDVSRIELFYKEGKKL